MAKLGGYMQAVKEQACQKYMPHLGMILPVNLIKSLEKFLYLCASIAYIEREGPWPTQARWTTAYWVED